MNTIVSTASLAAATKVIAPSIAKAESAVSGGDPIFAAIAAHREAFMLTLKAIKVRVPLHPRAPEAQAADAAVSAAHDVLAEAEIALIAIQPTTMAGVIALLDYIDDFHTQAIVLPEDPKNYHSEVSFLSDGLQDDRLINRFNGEPIELPFNFWIMNNVREALQTLTMQS
jgi:hypothetical protein